VGWRAVAQGPSRQRNWLTKGKACRRKYWGEMLNGNNPDGDNQVREKKEMKIGGCHTNAENCN